MKILVFGDIPGRDYWKEIVYKYIQEVDKVVFDGDYVDSYNLSFKKQVDNLKNIIDFQNKFPDKVITIIGNHDYHYLNNYEEIYSGFQGYEAKEVFSNLLRHLNLKLAYKLDNYLFTHAGLSKTWYSMWGENVDSSLPLDYQLNDIFKYTPKSLNFNGKNNYGDDITQSPIWIRQQSLLKDNYNSELIQVIGHTVCKKPFKQNNVIRTDSPDYCILLNTVTGDFEVIKIKQ